MGDREALPTAETSHAAGANGRLREISDECPLAVLVFFFVFFLGRFT
jgi:hypothetical protein